MALIQCPECQKDVSDKAAACIHCGFPIAQASADLSMQASMEPPLKYGYAPPQPSDLNPYPNDERSRALRAWKHEAKTVDPSPAYSHVNTQSSTQVVYVAKSRGLYIILSIFLGHMGINNFYSKHYLRGAVKLVLFMVGLVFPPLLIVCALWALGEAIFVTRDADGLAMN